MMTYQESKGQIKGFITLLIDTELYPKDGLLHVYWERWEIENGYDEIKCQQLENSIILRSQTVTNIPILYNGSTLTLRFYIVANTNKTEY